MCAAIVAALSSARSAPLVIANGAIGAARAGIVWLLGAVVLVPFPLFSAQAANRQLNAAAQGILAEHYTEEGPGAAVAVLLNGEIVIQTAMGMADIDEAVPIDSDAMFDLASVSKQFTAAAVLKLVADGRIDVRQPVQQYVPDFRIRSPGRPVRVADLVYHLSGLPDYSSDAWEGSDEEFTALTTETHLTWLNAQRGASKAAGIKSGYNNSGYVLLSLVVERVSGQPFAKFATTRLFRPAGMRTARVMDHFEKTFPRQVTGYAPAADGSFDVSYAPSSVTGDGNIYASLRDMVAWMRAFDGGSVLSEAQKRVMWTSGRFDSGTVIKDEGSGYGYGWVIESNARVSHSGSWYGTATYVLRDRKDSVSVIVLSNNEASEVGGIAEALADLVE